MKRWLVSALLLGTQGLSAHAVPIEAFAPPVLPANALAVPVTPQATDFSCGAAAVLSLLTYWNAGFEGNEEDLYKRLGTTRADGTHPKSIELGLKRLGLDATLKTGMTLADLRASLAAGETVILDIQAWKSTDNEDSWEDIWDDGHYVVLVAMDSTNAYVMDPSTKSGYAYLPQAELMKRWHDYEDRSGSREEYVQAGIIVKGTRGMRQFPGALTRLH